MASILAHKELIRQKYLVRGSRLRNSFRMMCGKWVAAMKRLGCLGAAMALGLGHVALGGQDPPPSPSRPPFQRLMALFARSLLILLLTTS